MTSAMKKIIPGERERMAGVVVVVVKGGLFEEIVGQPYLVSGKSIKVQLLKLFSNHRMNGGVGCIRIC